MASLARLIFRLDFPYSYEFLDRQGTAIRIMQTGRGDIWDTVGEDPTRHSIIGEKRTEHSFYNLAFEPTTINGVWEDASGLEVSRIIENEIFRLYDDKVREFTKEFNIISVARAGIRLYCADLVGWGSANVTRFSQLVRGSLSTSIQSTLGTVEDIGIHFVGLSDDGIRYNLNRGPLAEADIIKFYSRFILTPEQRASFLKNDLAADIDLFETNISFREHSLARWSRTKLEKGIAALRGIRELERQPQGLGRE